MAQTLTLGKLFGPFVETDLGDDGSRSSRWVDEEGVDGFSVVVYCYDVGSDGFDGVDVSFGGFDGLNGSGSEDGDSLSGYEGFEGYGTSFDME